MLFPSILTGRLLSCRSRNNFKLNKCLMNVVLDLELLSLFMDFMRSFCSCCLDFLYLYLGGRVVEFVAGGI